MTDFFVYILKCSDGSFYTGHTDNLDTRIAQHNAGHFGGYTSTRLPVELVFNERCQSRDAAFAAEQRIKGWSRAKKQALIARDWPALKTAARPPQERSA